LLLLASDVDYNMPFPEKNAPSPGRTLNTPDLNNETAYEGTTQ